MIKKVSLVLVPAVLVIGYFTASFKMPPHIISNNTEGLITKKEPPAIKRIKIIPKERKQFLNSYLKDELLKEGASEAEAGMQKITDQGLVKFRMEEMIYALDSTMGMDLHSALQFIASEDLDDHEKAFLLRRVLDKAALDDSNSFGSMMADIHSLQGAIPDEDFKTTVLYSVSLMAKNNIAQTLNYLDENSLDLVLDFTNSHLSEEDLQKQIYENAYFASLKAGDYYSLIHTLNNPLFSKNNDFNNIFKGVDHEIGISWLEQNRELLTEKQFSQALFSMSRIYTIEEGLTGINGDWSKELNAAVKSGDLTEALKYAELIRNDFSQTPFLRSFINNFVTEDFDNAVKWTDTIENEKVRQDLYKTLSVKQVHKDYDGTLSWALDLDEGSVEQANALSNISIQQARHNHFDNKSTDWLAALPEGIVTDRSQIGFALGLSRRYQDTDLEFTLKKMFISDEFDRDVSREAINSSSLPADKKETLLTILQ